MRKRIFYNMLMLALVGLAVLAAVLCVAFYYKFSSTVMDSLKNRAETFSDNSSQTAVEALAITKSSDMRVTVIAPDGTVVFDNTAQTDSMPNHSDRAEISDALQTGYGESKRFSDTLKRETAYYAVRLTDGYVLRVAKTSGSIFGMFGEALPAVTAFVLLIGIACYMLAGRLTKSIVAPINGFDLDAAADRADGFIPPYDELAPFIRAITEQRKRIDSQLSELQIRSNTISAIMDNMNEGVILLDKRGIILSANKSVLKIFEKDAQMDGRNILELSRDIELLEYVRLALEGKPGETGMERSGRSYRVYLSCVSDSGAIILFLDVTERVKAEKIRREFSANVSHELKTPLTTIYGNAEMLYNGMVKEEDKTVFYGKVKDEAGRLIALIEDIIMISRLDEDGGRETSEDVDIAGTAAEAAEALSAKASENKVSVRVTGENVNMSANRSMIYEMFVNLIDNAIKYNKPGGTVDVEINSIGKRLKISVSDTGAGIPAEAQSRVFERFYRVDKSRSRKTGGTGLGLAIVKHIVMALGGEIELRSVPDKGTVIAVYFPLGDDIRGVNA